MIVKLQLGYLEPLKDIPSEIPPFLDRRVLVVYTGNHESMDGLVEVKEEHIERLAAVRNGILSKVKRLASGEIPVHSCPPVQLDHSVSARDTVGRVVGDYEVDYFEPEPGDRRKALYTTLRFLGKENVEKAMDGRYHHVSFGGDLEKGDTQEISVTPFPAAHYAQLLSKKKVLEESYKGHKIVVSQGEGMDFYFEVAGHRAGPFQKEEDAFEQARQYIESCITSEKLTQGERKMLARLKSYLMRTAKLSEADAEKKLAEMPEQEKTHMAEEEKKEHEKLKGYLTGHKKMSEEDAEKHLSEMNMEKKKELSAEVDEHDKKLAAETDAAKAKMSAAKKDLTALSAGLKTQLAKAQLAQKKSKILTQLSRLRAEAKITPAEIKKIEIEKLAASNDATIEAVIKSYADREPVIFTGAFGARTGVSASRVVKDSRLSQLEAETRSNMPFLAQVMKNKMAAEGEHGKVKSEPAVQDVVPVHTAHMSEDEKKQAHEIAHEHMMKIHAAMDSGKLDEAKEHLKHLMDHALKHMMHPAHMGAEAGQQAEVEMSALADSVKTMQNMSEDIEKLVATIVGSDN